MANWARRFAAPVYVCVVFASAALVFLLQPLFARLTTPLLGGSPAVWNTSMVFFQAALLVGYAYAHALARTRSLPVQIAVHGAVLALACAVIAVTGHGAFKLAVSDALGPPNSAAPVAWLLGTLTLSVGAPYAALCATAPLLQSWYARTGRDDAADPYYLYAASNLGSLIGLGAYPLALEPVLGLTLQSALWAVGFALVGAGVVAAGWVAFRAGGGGEVAKPAPSETAAPIAPITWRRRLFWIAAAAAPSSLLLGVTNHISTDVASAPFLWVIPLALYLLTFVIAFSRNAGSSERMVALLQPISLAVLLMAMMGNAFWFALPATLVCFFLSALVCHLALSRNRPEVGALTEFYMWVSVGGVLGGAATALVAPVVFNDVYEFPLALAAIALFLPRDVRPLPLTATFAILAIGLLGAAQRILTAKGGPDVFNAHAVEAAAFVGLALLTVAASAEDRPSRFASVGLMSLGALGAAWIVLSHLFSKNDPLTEGPAVAALALTLSGFLLYIGNTREKVRELTLIFSFCLFVAIVIATWSAGPEIDRGPMHDLKFELSGPLLFLVLGVFAVALIANRARPWIAALIVIVSFVALDIGDDRPVVFHGRSFFGVTRVFAYPRTDGQLRVMIHGTTTHGAQYHDGKRVTEPLTYYNPKTALGTAVIKSLARFDTARLGLIGLGTGSTTCLKRPQDTMTIFEIDPMVVRFSVQEGLKGVFTFAPRCAPHAKVVLGDARVGISTIPDDSLDVLVVDAFSSDAVPAHLLTKEAIALYLRKLSPHGLIVLHLSNRNLDLTGEAARVAQEGGWGAREATIDPGLDPGDFTAYATVVTVIGRTQADVDAVGFDPKVWTVPKAGPGRAWSDEYINLIRPLIAHMQENKK